MTGTLLSPPHSTAMNATNEGHENNATVRDLCKCLGVMMLYIILGMDYLMHGALYTSSYELFGA